MKYFLSLLPIIFVFPLFSQISYEAENYAEIGDEYTISSVNTGLTGLNIGDAGEDAQWDFSQLGIQNQNERTFLNPDDAGYFLSFFAECLLENFGNIFYCNDAWNDLTNLAFRETEELKFGEFTFSNVVRHLNKNNNVLKETMLGLTFQGQNPVPFPLVVTYDEPDTLLTFPVTYQQNNQSTMRYVVDMTDFEEFSLFISSNQERSSKVDGWGSLTTPFGTFASTLRMRTVIKRTDTLALQENNIVIPEVETVLYQWLDKDFGVPVLEIEGLLISGSFEFYSAARYLDTVQCLSPNALFFTSPLVPAIAEGESTLEVAFNNTSTNANEYFWDFGDGNTSTEPSPTHTFEAGLSNISLVACNTGCFPAKCDTMDVPFLVIDPSPLVAGFVPLPPSVCLGESIQFNNISIQAEAYHWDLGDGSISEEENPTHTYGQPGEYVITLIASNANEADTTSANVIVSSPPNPDLGEDQSITNEETIELNPGDFGIYLWSNGSIGSTLTVDGSNYEAGEYPFWVNVVDQNGCTASDTINIVVSEVNSISELINKYEIELSPNPAKEQITLSYQLPFSEEVTVGLFSANGQWLQDIYTEKQNNGPQKHEMNISKLPAGSYWLKIGIEKGSQVVIPFLKQ